MGEGEPVAANIHGRDDAARHHSEIAMNQLLETLK
jgi:hypothetical protein